MDLPPEKAGGRSMPRAGVRLVDGGQAAAGEGQQSVRERRWRGERRGVVEEL